MEIEKQKIELKNVDLGAMKVVRTKMHPQSKELLMLCNNRLAEAMKCELNKDIAEFNLYAYPLMQDPSIAKNQNWVQYLRTKTFPENDKLSNWWRFFVTLSKESISNDALDELLDIVAVCINKSHDVNRICTGKTAPTIKEFFDVRLIDVGLSHQLYFLRLDADINMTEDLRNDPDWNGLNRQATINFALVNDLYSLKKEVAADGYKFNYVYLKMVNDKLNAQAAVDEIVLEIENTFRMTHVHGANLKRRNDPNLSRYVEAVDALLIGHIYWCTLCKRYNQF